MTASPSARRARVLLYNPMSGHGHMDSWLPLFARVLLALGHDVQVLTPGPDAFAARMGAGRTGLADMSHPALEMLPWSTGSGGSGGQDSLAAWADRWADRICFAADRYARRTPESLPAAGMPWSRRLKKRLLHRLLPPLHGLLAGCRDVRNRQDDTNAWFIDPDTMARHLAAAVARASRPPDLVFNLLLDKYRLAPRRWQAAAARMPLPWAGIRFSPLPPQTPEAYYALESLRGICLLDEQRFKEYAAAMPGKTFALLPDVTFAGLPETPSALVQEIRRRARGRRIVFLGGAIRGQKNPARWAGLVRRADPSRWFFVMVGEICRSALTAEDAQALDALLADPPEHFLAQCGYVEDEREFNALIALADVLFAVYRQFPYSSNMLGKAAFFEKPLLAAQGYLVGSRVERDGIGRTVPEDDEAAMLAALEDLAAHPVPAARFAACREALSEAQLGQVLERFVADCLGHGAG
ncbi:glycosyltransferase family protein [Megalodesulfovibrio gigas]|uniref:Glycosyltransferase n=1 Tax=Megalodesulfovibrio gigas (strain ATCC 19364 / DSM 1382 / NCIMB 9332 / VKM B-1759) TaxID=1121448 RepID=T2GF97_MEGG1|nr:hypothetical protein [Megalodesulfovibrio gigas]AGW15255.1 hypothetical protein DGI_4043 [Megalodesulfovibrio gigas DSM 1382 = ATCC 19364]